MALHKAKEKMIDAAADIFTSPISEQPLSKRTIPDFPARPGVVYQLLRNELLLDGNAAQNLATFCTTWTDDEVRRLMDLCLDKNIVDKDEYPQTAEIESRCVNILAGLWHAPVTGDGSEPSVGCSTTGSSEAAMLCGLALKWRWRDRRRAAGQPADRPNLVCGPVQVCWEKFARYFDVELRQVPVEPGATGLQAHQLRAYVDENTIGVVAILGVTYTCTYEPVAEIAAELDRIQAETGLDVPVHVDAASGGFIAPSCTPAWSGTSACPGSPRSTPPATSTAWPPRRGLGSVARQGGAAGRPGLPRRLPRRRHAHPRPELLPPRRPGRRPVLHVPAPGPRGVPARLPGVCRHGTAPRPADRRHGPLHPALRRHRGPARRLLDPDRSRRDRLEPVRPVRPAPHARLAGPVLPAAARPPGDGDPAGARAARRRPGRDRTPRRGPPLRDHAPRQGHPRDADRVSFHH